MLINLSCCYLCASRPLIVYTAGCDASTLGAFATRKPYMVRTVGTVVAGVTSKPLNAFIEMGYYTAVQNTKPGQVPKIYPDDHSTQSRGKKVWLDYSVKYKKITIMYWDQHSARRSLHKKLARPRISQVLQHRICIWYIRRFRGNRMAPCRPDISTHGMVAAYATHSPIHGLLSTLDDLMWKA